MRWSQVHCETCNAAADGEDVWSWRPKAGVKLARSLASDGDNKRLVTEESSEETVKPLRREWPVKAAYLW
jgi:hypothetical protein